MCSYMIADCWVCVFLCAYNRLRAAHRNQNLDISVGYYALVGGASEAYGIHRVCVCTSANLSNI